MRPVLLMCLIAALTAPAFAQGGVPAEAGRLVPTDAVGVVVVPSFARMETILTQVMGHFGQPAEMAQGMMAELKSEDGPLGPVADLLDGTSPVIVAISMPEGGGMSEPGIAIIVKVSDVAAAAERMPGTASGSWFGFSPLGGELAVAPQVSALVNGIDVNQLTVRLNLAPVMEAYGSLLIGGIEMGASQIPMDQIEGIDIDAIIDALIAGTEAFVASADRFEWTLGFDGAHLDHRLNLNWLKDSPIAKMGAAKPTVTAQSLAGMLSKDYMVSAVSSYDMRELMAFYAKFIDLAMENAELPFGEMPGGEAMEGYIKAAKELMPLVTGRQAMGFDIETGNLAMASIAEVTDGAKYLDLTSKMMGSFNELLESMGIEVKSSMTKGEKGADMSMEIIPGTKFEETLGMEGVTALIEKLIGGKLAMTGAARGKFVAASFGGANAPKASAMEARMLESGPAPKELGKALALGGQNAQFAMTMDLGALARGITGMLKELPEAPMNIPDYAKVKPAGVWVGMGNSPAGFTMGAKVDLKGIGAIAKAAMN